MSWHALSNMLERLIQDTPICSTNQWGFIPVGYNLGFEHEFLIAKSRLHELPEIDVLSHPCIDLRGIGILMNCGEFKGSGLDKITGKKQSGEKIPERYSMGQYGFIERYIEDETREFMKWYMWMLETSRTQDGMEFEDLWH